MSLLLSFAFDVRECIPNLLAFLGVPERESKLGQENLRFLGPPFGNHSLSLFFQRLSYIFADLSQNSHVSAHKYDLVLILPHHYKQFSHVPCASSGNDFHKSFYCFLCERRNIFTAHVQRIFDMRLLLNKKKTKSWSVLEAVVKLRRQRGKCVLLACLNILQLHSYLI